VREVLIYGTNVKLLKVWEGVSKREEIALASHHHHRSLPVSLSLNPRTVRDTGTTSTLYVKGVNRDERI
jgi:hypothetical protein